MPLIEKSPSKSTPLRLSMGMILMIAEGKLEASKEDAKELAMRFLALKECP